MSTFNRRDFLKTALLGGAGLLLVSRNSLFAGISPNKRIQFAQIGCGRMGSTDMGGLMNDPRVRLVAVCDLDSKRAEAARTRAVQFYQKKGESQVEVKAYHDYREVLARPDIDAVVVSTPDHWHALVAIEAAIAGKHLYVQKPITYNIAEAVALQSVVRAKKVILQTGSQQRSETFNCSFRMASEAARNGRLGKLHRIQIGIGLDKPSGKAPSAGTAPATFDFERWLGPAPEQAYMEMRTHPQSGFGRPGWITTEDFGLGMITNWGAHHIDIAQWGMGQELGGPISIDARANFMKDDIWTVHHDYHVEMVYPGDIQVVLDNKFDNGIRFEGSDGWIFCSRGSEKVTSADGNAGKDTRAFLLSSNPELMKPTDQGGVHWPASKNHYSNWIDGILSNHDPISPIDQSVCSLQTCAAAWIGMKLGRKLQWTAAKSSFVNDPEANGMRERKARKPEYDFNLIMGKAGLDSKLA